MFSLGFFPVINKPTRITTSSATLIDNIWSNDISNVSKYSAGLIIDDVSDHLPIFYAHHSLKLNEGEVPTETKYVRQESENNLNKMFQSLQNINWSSSVLNQNNVNGAYNNFMSIYNNAHDECCPLKKVSQSKNKKEHKVWMTKGLKNACKKKNALYKSFLQKRNQSSEVKYKKYKNKLQTILRQAEKMFYNDLLHTHKNDMKGTWNIINTVLKRNFKTQTTVNKFVKDGQIIEAN